MTSPLGLRFSSTFRGKIGIFFYLLVYVVSPGLFVGGFRSHYFHLRGPSFLDCERDLSASALALAFSAIISSLNTCSLTDEGEEG